MAQVVNAGMASPRDLRTLGVKQGATVTIRDNAGNPVQVPASALQQQRALVNQLLKDTRRSTQKYITAKFASSADNKTFVLGNAGALSADASAAEITETYQNASGAAGSAASKTAFKEFIKYSPFSFVGVKVSVSDKTIYDREFTELINDIDKNTTEPFTEKMDAGENIYSQEDTVRFLNIAGEFGPCWGLKSTLNTDEWIKFSFNCVDIQRRW